MVHQKTDSRVEQKPRDYTVIKVMVALVLLIASVFALRAIGRVYATVSGFDAIYPAAKTVAIVALVLAAASIVGLIAGRKSVVGTVSSYVLPVALLAAFSALVLRRYLNDQMRLLYFVHAAVYCLYIIFSLYGSEFFCFSLATILSGFCFYFFSKGLGLNARTAIMAVIVALVLAVTSLLANRAAKDKGRVHLAKKTLQLFPVRFNATVLYVACAVLACCLIASLLLGPAFAYYCMFAAVAIELIGAVYYTFQLK